MLHQNRNLKSIDHVEVFGKPNCEIKKLIKAITHEERNSGFIQKYAQTYQFKPDRMFDFFLTSFIIEKMEKQEALIPKILNKIIENTMLYRNTIILLRETLKEPEQANKLAKYARLVLNSNTNLSTLKWLKMPWYSDKVQTKNGKLLKLNGKDIKFPSIIKIGSYLPFRLGKKIKNRFLLKRIVKLSELQELDLSNWKFSFNNFSEFRKGLELSSKGKKSLVLTTESKSFVKNIKNSISKGNQLSSLPESISSLKNLQMLDLKNNQLSSLPESISELQKLQELNLRQNRILSLPASISKLQQLFVFDLSNNRLVFLTESISELQNLRRLNLSNNQLSSLPESISLLKNLQELDLNYNQLLSLPKSISELQKLRVLNIRNNALSLRSKSLKDTLKSLKNNGCKIYR